MEDPQSMVTYMFLEVNACVHIIKCPVNSWMEHKIITNEWETPNFGNSPWQRRTTQKLARSEPQTQFGLFPAES